MADPRKRAHPGLYWTLGLVALLGVIAVLWIVALEGEPDARPSAPHPFASSAGETAGVARPDLPNPPPKEREAVPTEQPNSSQGKWNMSLTRQHMDEVRGNWEFVHSVGASTDFLESLSLESIPPYKGRPSHDLNIIPHFNPQLQWTLTLQAFGDFADLERHLSETPIIRILSDDGETLHPYMGLFAISLPRQVDSDPWNAWTKKMRNRQPRPGPADLETLRALVAEDEHVFKVEYDFSFSGVVDFDQEHYGEVEVFLGGQSTTKIFVIQPAVKGTHVAWYDTRPDGDPVVNAYLHLNFKATVEEFDAELLEGVLPVIAEEEERKLSSDGQEWSIRWSPAYRPLHDPSVVFRVTFEDGTVWSTTVVRPPDYPMHRR